MINLAKLDNNTSQLFSSYFCPEQVLLEPIIQFSKTNMNSRWGQVYLLFLSVITIFTYNLKIHIHKKEAYEFWCP